MSFCILFEIIIFPPEYKKPWLYPTAYRLKKPWALAPMAFALFKAIKAWVQAPKVKIEMNRKSLHGKEIKKKNGPIVKKNVSVNKQLTFVDGHQ
jgi:hypothetical protein